MSDFKAWLKRHRIAVIMGGDSAERDISLKTGGAILKSLQRQGIRADAVDAKKDLPGQLRRKRAQLAYVALHGPGGEDGVVQGLLEWMKIPYTGSGVLASALAMDKISSKRLFQSAGLRTSPWFALTKNHVTIGTGLAKRLGFPLVVKPSRQGSAIGISIVHTVLEWTSAIRAALEFGPELLIERYMPGTEITVGVLGDKTLPIIEIIPSAGPFYDYKAKYAPGGSRHILPARIAPNVARKANDLAIAACKLLGIRAVARVDLIVDRKTGPSLLEVNTIPGMTQTSLLPEAAQAAGLDFDALVLKIAELSFGPTPTH